MSTPTNEQREAEIRARLAVATRGPWKVAEEVNPLNDLGRQEFPEGIHGMDPTRWIVTERDHPQLHGPAPVVSLGISPFREQQHALYIQAADAALIANAPADLSWLLSRIEELAKERDAANAILEELETLTGFTQTALVDEWLCVSKDAARLDWLEAHGLPDEKENDGSTLREAIDAAMSGASSSGANTT